MVSRETRELIEDVANLVAIQIAAPIEKRLTILETKISCRGDDKRFHYQSRWKWLTFLVGVPGWLMALYSFISLVR